MDVANQPLLSLKSDNRFGFQILCFQKRVKYQYTKVASAPKPGHSTPPPPRQPRFLISLLPITAPLFFFFANQNLRSVLTLSGAALCAAGGSLGCVFLYIAWPTLAGPGASPRTAETVQGVLTVIAFVQSVMWMDLAAGELVGLFTTVGRISGTSESLLGCTIFAWGISVGDMVGRSGL